LYNIYKVTFLISTGLLHWRSHRGAHPP